MKTRLAKFGILGLATAALGAAAPAMAQDQEPPRIFVNGEKLRTRVAPMVEDGRTLVPLRAIFEKLGASVDFNPYDNRIVARRGNNVVRLRLDSTEASINEANVTLDVPATAYYGTTLVPLRFVSEALGAEVDYDYVRNVVDVNDPRTDRWNNRDGRWGNGWQDRRR